MMFTYMIKGRAPTKKNSQRLVTVKGRTIPIPSKAYKAYEAQASQYLFPKPDKPIETPVELMCVYFLPLNKNGTVPKNAPDLVNLLEATQDILVKYKILADDNSNIVKSVDGSRVYFTNGELATFISITEINDEKISGDRSESDRKDTFRQELPINANGR